MENELINNDFDYYKRTVQKIYQDYYKKLIIIFSLFLIIELIAILLGEPLLLGIILLVLLGLTIFYLIKKYQSFPSYYEEERKNVGIAVFTEDSNHYFIEKDGLKFLKSKSRNLVSQERGLTYFVGLQPFNIEKPVYIYYYDHLEMNYTEKYKLNKNNVNYTATRWKYRFASWFAAIPAVIVFIYFFFFRLSFISNFFMNLFSRFIK